MAQESSTGERRHSLMGVAIAVAAGIVLGGLALTVIVALLAAVFHLVGWLLHVAIIVALIAGVWWLLVGRRRHC